MIPLRSSLGQSKRARLKEHRLSENTMSLVCRLRRAQGLTRLIRLFLVCALGEQRKLPSLPILELHLLPRTLSSFLQALPLGPQVLAHFFPSLLGPGGK